MGQRDATKTHLSEVGTIATFITEHRLLYALLNSLYPSALMTGLSAVPGSIDFALN